MEQIYCQTNCVHPTQLRGSTTTVPPQGSPHWYPALPPCIPCNKKGGTDPLEKYFLGISEEMEKRGEIPL